MKRFFSLLLVPAVLLCACAAPAPWEGAEPYEVEATAELLRDFALEKEDGGPSGASVWTAPSAFGYRSADNGQEILSLPYVIYRYTDIAEGEATWTAELRLAELSRSPQGEAAPSGGASAVSCRNVELSFGCGARTVLVRAPPASVPGRGRGWPLNAAAPRAPCSPTAQRPGMCLPPWRV